MADIIGTVASVMTLASVFKVCIEGFDLIRAGLNHDVEVKKLTLKLKVERCRLVTWGQSVGLISNSAQVESTLLTNFQYADTIREILEYLIEIFQNSSNLVDRYGCRKLSTSEVEQLCFKPRTPSEKLSAAFDKHKRRITATANRAKDLVVWAVNDQKKFTLLIRDAKEFIDGLQDITKELVSTRQQEDEFSHRIQKINDPETLHMITEVCETDHPSFSDSASARAEAISGTNTEPPDVLDWVQSTSEPSSSNSHYDIDDWDKTELKQRYLDLIKASEQPIPSLGTILKGVHEVAPWKAPKDHGYFCGHSECPVTGWPMLGSFMDHMYEKHPGQDFEAEQHLKLNRSMLSSTRTPTTISRWRRTPRILMVEDDPTCRRIGMKFLREFDCSVEHAIDGVRAVEKMSQTRGKPESELFDLILMDIIMPNLDGVSACHLIKQFDDITIIAMTSCIRAEDIQLYYQYGMADCLPKPFTRSGLLQILRKHLPLLDADEVIEPVPSSQHPQVENFNKS
jgi:CheY-like chemotaxis protein